MSLIKKPNKNRPPILEALEPRILFSADAFGAALDNYATDDPLADALDQARQEYDALLAESKLANAQQRALEHTAQSDVQDALPPADEQNEATRELVFVDTDTPHYQQLVDDLAGNADSSRQFQVILLDNSADGIAQITDALAQYTELDAVHIISHGVDGSIDLGNTQLNEQSLIASSDAIAQWSNAFTVNGDLLIYGCDLAATSDGELLVNRLAAMTGADVAASDDLTGSAARGGDWELEYHSGVLETDVVLSQEAQIAYSGLLAPNQAPINNLPATQNTAEDTSLVLSNANGNAISTGDIDAGSNEIEVKLDVTDGTITLTNTIGPEFLVNTETADAQKEPQIALAEDGRYVVVWQSKGQDNIDNTEGIYAQAYNADGTTSGVELLVNSITTAGKQLNPSVAIDNDGDFVVVWESDDAGLDEGIWARMFDFSGTALTGEIQVNQNTTDPQINASVAMDSDGDFVVVWESDNGTGDSNIYMRVFDNTGSDVTGELQVSQAPSDDQKLASVAMDATGNFVVAWQSKGQDGDKEGIYARRYDAAGTALDNEFLVNQTVADSQKDPAIAMDTTGNFVIVWQTKGQDNIDGREGVYGRRFDAAGNALDNEFSINSTTPNSQKVASVAMNDSGEFVVAWEGKGQDFPDGKSGVFAQYFDAAGNAAGTEFQVNTFTALDQKLASIGIQGDGEAIAVWQSKDQDTDREGVYGQQFLTPDAINYTVNDGVDDTTVTFRGTVDAVNNAMDGLTFTPDADFVGTATIQITTNDLGNTGTGGALSDVDTLNITVTPVNDAPVHTMPVAQTVTEDTALLLSSGGGNAISISDDAAGNPIEVTLVATNGSMTLTGETGLSFSTGGWSNDTTMVFTGTLADINAALDGMSFTPTANFTGDAYIQIATDDQGNIGVGGNLFDVDTLTITVTPDATNEAPLNTVPGAQATPLDTDLEFSTNAGNGITIIDDAGSNPVEVTLSVNNGTLTLSSLVGDETQVNTYIADEQRFSQVARADDGRYVVVWQSNNQDGNGEGIYAQRFNPFGEAEGPEFLVNTTTGGNQELPSIAMNANGDFVIAWQGTDGDNDGVFAQRYDAGGSAMGSEFLVNSEELDAQQTPAVAIDDTGNFVIVWASKGQDNLDGRQGIYGQRFDMNGNAIGAEFKVNTYTLDDQSDPAIAMDADGDFVVSWTSRDQDTDGDGIYAQRFNATGVAQGPEFKVNTEFTDHQTESTVAMNAAGDFVIAWNSNAQDTDGNGIYLQRFNSAGVAQGVEEPVNTTFTDDQTQPSVVMSDAGDFVVAWTSRNQDGDAEGVYFQRFDAAGAKFGNETLLNTETTDAQTNAHLAMDSDGNVIATWTSKSQDTDREGIYLQDLPHTGAITFSSGTGVNDSSMVFTGTVTDINKVLDGLIFTPTTSFSGDATLEITVNDQGNTGTGGDKSDSDSVQITVGSGGNIAPTITLPGAPVNYTAGAAATLIDPGATLVDPDTANFTGGSLTVDFTAGSTANDRLAIRDEGVGVNNISISGSDVRYDFGAGPLAIGTFSGGTDGSTPLVIALNANADDESVEALMQNITFENVSGTPVLEDRSVRFVLNDGEGGTSNSESEIISILDANDAPTLGNGTLTAVDEDTASPAGETVATIFAGQFSDPDAGSSFSGIAVIGNSANAGTEGAWQYSTNSGSNWFDIGAVADDNTALAISSGTLVRFVPAADFEGVPTSLDVRGMDNTYVAGFSDTAGSETRVTVDSSSNGGATAIAGSSSSLDTSITSINDAPTLNSGSLTAVNEATVNPAGEAVSTIFSGQFSDVDSGSSMSGIAVIGNTANAVSEGSWQYSTNAGTDWFDIGTVADDNTALAISSSTLIRFVPASGFSGAPADLSVRGVDNVYAGAFSTTAGSESRVNLDTTTNGGSSAIAAAPANVSTNVTDNEFLWLVSKDNVASPSGANGLDSWTDSTALQFGEPDLTLGAGITDGNLSAVFELDTFAGADARIHALHQVTRDLSLGGSSFPTIDVKAGDILFATKDAHTLTSGNSVNNNSTDVVLFSPTTLGDYSTGTFTILLENVNGNDIHGLTLVEESTTLADGTVLNEGDFLLSTTGVGNERQLFWFVTDDVGDGGNTAGTMRTLLDGNDTNINLLSDFKGIDLVETNTTIGGLNLTAGQILISTKDSITGGSNNLLFTSNDVVALSISQTTWSAGAGNGAASVAIVMDGDNIGLDSDPERVHALSIGKSEFGSAPVQSSIEGANLTFTENDAATQITNTIAIADVDDTHIESAVVQISTNYANGEDVLLFTNTGTITGVWNVGTGTMTLTGSDTLANYEAALRSISYQNTSDDPSTATRTVSFTANDGDLNSNPLTRDIDVAATNDDPTVDNIIPDQAATEDTAFSFAFNANTFGDVDSGDTLTYSATLSGGGALPSWLTFNAATRTFSGTPLNDDVGTISVEVTADDGNGGTPATDTFDIVISNTNDDPTVDNVIPDQAATEDSAFSFAFNANTFGDVDSGDTLTYSATLSGGGALPGWLTFNAGTRTFSGTPLNADVGTISVEVTADDGNGGTPATDTFDIVIANSNDDPTLDNAIPDQAATEDSAFSFAFNANTFGDVDSGDTLTYSATLSGGGALPSWLTFNAATRTFSGTPLNDDVGTISVEVTADDGNGGTPATDTFDIVISNTNDDPTVDNVIPDQAATEDTAFSFAFNANTFGDVDSGDTLTYSATLSGGGALPSWLTFNAGTRTFSGTPLNADVGTISVEVTADDGNGGTPATDTFDIVISNTNDDPTVDNVIPDQAATEDTAFSFAFNANTFGDVDSGDTLTYSATLSGGAPLPSWLTFNAGTRTFSGTPLNADVGTISVEVTADDGNGGTPATDTFDIVISNTNDDPTVDNVIPDQAATEDSAFSFAFNANTFGDVDSGDTLTYSATLSGGGALPGWLTFNAGTRTFSGTPLNADVGTISVEVTADDGNGGTPATDTFDIVIANSNDDPTLDNAIPDQAATEDSAFSFAFNANTFGDVDSGDTLTYSATLSGGGALPSWLTFNAATRTFSGTPLNADVGTISVEVTADDGNGGTPATDTFDIVVSNTNDDPTVDNIIPDQAATEDTAFSFAFNANTFGDVDSGDTLTYSATLSGGGALPSWLTFNAGTRTFSGTPLNADVGTISVEVTADDGNGGTPATDTFDIVISNTNDDPTVDNVIPDQAATEDTAFSFAFNANTFGDVDSGDTLTYSATLSGGAPLPSWLTFNAGTRTFSGTPLNADVGTISVEVTADDGNGGTPATDTFDIVISNTNDDPTVDNVIPDQAATEDSAFSFAFNANTFGDVDSGDTLTYSATLSGGGALPGWLTFNAATRTFSGTPLNADVGTISVEVTADDGNGGTPATDTFDIVIANSNDDPTLDNAIPDQAATEDSAFSFAFNANTFGDVDSGDTLTYSATLSGGAPLPGWLTFNAATRTFSGTPLNADVGTISVEVTADDGNGGTPATDTFDIVVSNTNDDPTVDNIIPDQAATEDTAFSFAFNANTFGDVDSGDTLTYSATLSGGAPLPGWLTFNAGTRTFSGTPLNADVGTISVEVTADDGNGGTPATDTFDIVISNTNDDPTVDNVIPDQAATEDTAFSFAFNANTFGDVDSGDTLTYSATLSGGAPLPSWLTFNAGTRTFSGTPLNADVGTISVEVTADDGNGGTPATDTFDIVISNTNDDPTVDNVIPDQAATEDSAFSFAFNANTFGDVDSGDTLTYSATLSGGGALPGWLTFNAATRTFSGTPLNADVGTISVEVTADDGNGGTPATDTFDIVIANSNDDPTLDNAIPDQAATEDSAFSFAFNANTFGDVDSGDTLTYSATLSGGAPLPGWLTFNAATRTFSGTPLNADVGTISVEVTADDGNGGTPATDTFDIVVSNTNDDPTVDNIIPDQAATEDTAFSFAFNANTFGDVDSGDTLTYSATLSGGAPLPGWLTFNAGTRTFSGTPLNADVGTISVEVTADDGNGGTPATDTFDIVISNTNDDPTVDNVIPDQAATEDTAFSFAFNANTFGDVDSGDTLTYSATLSGGAPLPSWLTFNAGTRTFSGTPLNADVGTISVEVTADDGNGGTPATDTFDIVISNTNDDPTVDNVIPDQAATEDSAFSFAFNANTFGDVDSGDTLTYSATLSGGGALPGWLTFNAATRTFSGTPLNADVGTISVEVTADDGNGGTPATDTFDIVIANSNDDPTLDNAIPDQAATEDSAFSFAFNANTFGDVDSGDTLTYSATLSGGGALPSWLTFNAATRTFSGTPLNADVGTISVEVTADDGNGGTPATDTFDIVISNTNDDPTVDNVIPDQAATEDSAFSFAFNANTFGDVDSGDTLTYSATLSGGGALPGWLTFNAATRTFSGTPLNADVGTISVEVTADDGNGGTPATDTFDIVIANTNDDPTVDNPIPDQNTDEDSLYNYTFNANTFGDVDASDTLTYTAQLSGGAALPSWLAFDGNTRSFVGVPLNADVGFIDIEVIADDGTSTVSDVFRLTIDSVNDAPVNTVPGTQTVVEETATAIPGISIADVDAGAANLTTRLQVSGGTLNISLAGSASIASGSNNSGDLTILGTVADINATLATLMYTGGLDLAGIAADTLTVTTNDGGNTGSGGALQDSDVVQIDITNVNDDPTLDNPIPDQAATEDSAFNFTFNANTFGDVDSGDTLTYSATLSGGAPLPAWLSFDSATRTFSGTPLNADVGTLSVEVTADDGNGGTPATDTFDIVVANTNNAPTFGGTNTGAVTEDVDPDTDGLLEVNNIVTVSDPDAGESSFVADTINGTYGDLVIDAAGNWIYAADNTQAAIQQLDVTESITDTLTVTTFDGTTHDIVITINGAEDAPVQGGATTGTVAEDGTLVDSGALTITDTDINDNPISYNNVGSTAGDNGYGTFELTGNTWTYTLNNSHAAVQALDAGETLTDTYTFTASDSSTQLVSVTINGAEDAPTASDNTIRIAQNTSHTLSASDFGFSDIDGDTMNSVRITALETAGDLKLAGSDVNLNDIISRADIDAGLLSWQPTGTESGDNYATFGFSVNDGAVDSGNYSISYDVTTLFTTDPDDPEDDPDEENTPPEITPPPSDPEPEEETTEPEQEPVDEIIDAPQEDIALPEGKVDNGEIIQPLSAETIEEITRDNDKQDDGREPIALKQFDLANLQLADYSLETLEIFRQISFLDNDKFVQALDNLGEELARASSQDNAEYALGAETRLGIAVSLSAGFVSWALRAGSLMASFFTVMPLWKQLDPFPIIGGSQNTEQEPAADHLPGGMDDTSPHTETNSEGSDIAEELFNSAKKDSL